MMLKKFMTLADRIPLQHPAVQKMTLIGGVLAALEIIGRSVATLFSASFSLISSIGVALMAPINYFSDTNDMENVEKAAAAAETVLPGGLPEYGAGMMLAGYHKQSNPRSIMNSSPDPAGIESYIRHSPFVPVFRDYCSFDYRAGVTAMRIVPDGSHVKVITQGNAKNSMAGRAQIYDPALDKYDFDAADTRLATVSCSGQSCQFRFQDGSPSMSVRWHTTATDATFTRQGSEETWYDCKCVHIGSTIDCDGLK